MMSIKSSFLFSFSCISFLYSFRFRLILFSFSFSFRFHFRKLKQKKTKAKSRGEQWRRRASLVRRLISHRSRGHHTRFFWQLDMSGTYSPSCVRNRNRPSTVVENRSKGKPEYKSMPQLNQYDCPWWLAGTSMVSVGDQSFATLANMAGWTNEILVRLRLSFTL